VGNLSETSEKERGARQPLVAKSGSRGKGKKGENVTLKIPSGYKAAGDRRINLQTVRCGLREKRPKRNCRHNHLKSLTRKEGELGVGNLSEKKTI